MFNQKIKEELKNCTAQLVEAQSTIAAIKHGVATIEFSPEGNILDVNKLFLNIAGYKKNEVVGAHHSVMCESNYVSSKAYKNFWEDLLAGKTNKGMFERRNKQGDVIWLEAAFFKLVVA